MSRFAFSSVTLLSLLSSVHSAAFSSTGSMLPQPSSSAKACEVQGPLLHQWPDPGMCSTFSRTFGPVQSRALIERIQRFSKSAQPGIPSLQTPAANTFPSSNLPTSKHGNPPTTTNLHLEPLVQARIGQRLRRQATTQTPSQISLTPPGLRQTKMVLTAPGLLMSGSLPKVA